MYCVILLIDERMLSVLERHLPQRLVNQWRARLGLFVVPSLSEKKRRKVSSTISVRRKQERKQVRTRDANYTSRKV